MPARGPSTSRGCTRRRRAISAVAAWPPAGGLSSTPQTVKSTCSVNATAGRPTPTARWQVGSMEAFTPVSQENSECTWLSGGSTPSPDPQEFHLRKALRQRVDVLGHDLAPLRLARRLLA